MNLHTLIICVFVFLAGFVDSIAGGGGLISLPAYLFSGLPVHNAIATNKFSASCGTTFSALTFSKHGALDWKIAIVSAVASFIASYVGSSVALMIDDNALEKIILLVIPLVAFFLLFKRNFGESGLKTCEHIIQNYAKAFFIGLIIGFYDGLIGPGTGTFAIIAYSLLLKYNLVAASGNAKVLNLASNYASVIAFWVSGKIIFSIGIPAAICGVIGNYLGSSLAIKKGPYFIKIVMVIVLVIFFLRIIIGGL